MKLWLLRPIDDKAPPWSPWYDKCFGMVIRAESQFDARAIAMEWANSECNAAWQSESLSSCEELTVDGPAQPIMLDIRWRNA